MKKRIENLLDEIFEYETPKLLLSVDKICVEIGKGENYRGSFQIENGAQGKMKGFVYSTNLRVGYEPAAFQAISEKIVFEADTTGLSEGDVLEGAFVICSDLGEYKLPYEISIRKNQLKTSTHSIDHLSDFIQLAHEDYQKAYMLFVSELFQKLLLKEAPEKISLYEGLTKQNVSCSSLEEFLVGIGAKERVHIALEKNDTIYENIHQTELKKVTLTKENWGFQTISVKAEGDFLKIEHPVITTEEFIGSTYQMEYIIDFEKLHAGNNYGSLVLCTPFQTVRYEITIKNPTKRKSAFLREHKYLKAIIEQYMDFQLGRIERKKWLEKSFQDLDAYQKYRKNPLLQLYRAQLLFMNEKEEEACLVLEEIDIQRTWKNDPEIQAYYLYLTTFYNKEKEYVQYAEERVMELFGQNLESWKIQWVLLQMNEKLNKYPSERLEAIKNQYLYGCRSRFMYLEAWKIINKNPILLKNIGDFELQIMRFICREKLLTDELVMQIGDLGYRYRQYSKELIQIMKSCYDYKASDALVRAICSMLIKGNQTDPEAFRWYEKAVEADVRITGLYEYYIESMDQVRKEPLPQIVKMYFAYNNTLSFQKKAFVYANVIRNQEQDARTFLNYRPVIEKFMIDQLIQGNINDDLALIYVTFLNKHVINRAMVENLAKFLFTYEFSRIEQKAKYLIVLHNQLKREQKIAITGNRVYLQIYTDDYQILLEDSEGNRYLPDKKSKLKKVLVSEKIFQYCRELASENREILLCICGKQNKNCRINEKNVKDFCALIAFPEIEESYKTKLRQQILDYYMECAKSDSLEEFLTNKNIESFALTDKGKLVDIMTREGMSQEAFELIGKYGPEQVDLHSLVRICSRCIMSFESEENELLVAISWYCFERGKYEETMLSYLLKYYDGPIENMRILWKSGFALKLDTFALEEKTLMMTLFMDTHEDDTEEIFESYIKHMGKKKLIEAYAVSRSYDYFVRKITVKRQVFDYIEKRFQNGEEDKEICILALLCWYADFRTFTDVQKQNVRRILEILCYKGKHFAFFKEFDTRMLRPFQLQDKNYIEYRTKPESVVYISWHLSGEDGKSQEMSEIMKNMYEGIYVKEFTLFYGDVLYYTIFEETEGTKQQVQSGSIHWKAKSMESSDTSYDLLNRLSKSIEKDDEAEAKEIIRKFLEQECLAEHLFTLM